MNNLSKIETDTLQLPSVKELRTVFEPYLASLEENRQLPDPVVEILSNIGVFRMLSPKVYGGQELAFPSALELVRSLAMVDGSIGWIAAINSGAALVMPKLPIAALDTIYAKGPDQIIAGSAQPFGLAQRAPGGWTVSGRWPFASGCTAANWIIAGFKECDPSGVEQQVTKQLVLPAQDFDVEDTWKVMGLRGTGSHHIALREKFVSEAFVLTLGPGPLSVDAPLYRQPAHLIPLGHGAVHLGIAQAAIEDVLHLHRQRPSNSSGRREMVEVAVGKSQSRLRAAQAAFNLQVSSSWSNALTGLPGDPAALASNVQILVHIAAETLDIVRTCFEIAGTAAIYEECSLERRLRDIEVATQHGLVQRANWLAGGKTLINGL
jgi:indole-3-acetate monooxygenase